MTLTFLAETNSMDDIKKTYCVIGDPIKHSLSPEIHNLIYQYIGIDFHYESLWIKSDSLSTFVEESKTLGRPGFNVTIPHKESIIPLLNKVDPLAKRIGAVNTVANRNGELIGYNTDITGFTIALKMNGYLPGEKAVILGAGGAARAVVVALYSLGLRQLAVLDIVPERAEKLKTDFKNLDGLKIIAGPPKDKNLEDNLKETTLLINATPVGMWPEVDKSPLPHTKLLQLLPDNTIVFDIVYRPVITLLLANARSRGLKTISGLSMLISQAIAAEEIWLGRKLPEELFGKVWKHISKILEENG